MNIRPATAADLPALAALENACNPAPWSAGQLQAAPAHGIQRILLEVRAGNAAAQALYRRNGFIECGRRKGYYGGVEDAVLMEKTC